jgi:hypothetical protein
MVVGKVTSIKATYLVQVQVLLHHSIDRDSTTTDGGSSRNTTTTVCEVANLRRKHVLTKKALRSICSQKPFAECTQVQSKIRTTSPLLASYMSLGL